MDISKVNDVLDSIKSMDIETYDHLERTAMFTFALAKALKLEPKQLEQAYFAGLLHDVGVLSAVSRDKRECAVNGSMMLRLIDDSKIIATAVKHQHDFYLQEEISFELLLSEIIALSSRYDELRHTDGLQHEQALDSLKQIVSFKEAMLNSFDEILRKEDLI